MKIVVSVTREELEAWKAEPRPLWLCSGGTVVVIDDPTPDKVFRALDGLSDDERERIAAWWESTPGGAA